MTASERLRELATTDFWPDPDFSIQQGHDVWAAIVSVIEAAEQLPEFFQVDGRDHSFVPLLDVLREHLEGFAVDRGQVFADEGSVPVEGGDE